MHDHPSRRAFISQLGIASAAVASNRGVALESPQSIRSGALDTWDMSWLESLKTARYRAVVDVSTLEDGYGLALAAMLMDQTREVHGVRDDDVKIVLVHRRGGTPIVFGDTLWERFPLGEETKQADGATKAPVRHNPFHRPTAGASAESAANKLATLQKRGVIVLVCNIAATNWSHTLAEATKRDAATVKKEVFANLVAGTIVVPSGVFALMRAQNAGCAYMRGV
jgi:intracellular sulfur oxidation DsrE/DsrF family protein